MALTAVQPPMPLEANHNMHKFLSTTTPMPPEDNKNAMHPFFTKPRRNSSHEDTHIAAQNTVERSQSVSHDDPDYDSTPSGKESKKRARKTGGRSRKKRQRVEPAPRASLDLFVTRPACNDTDARLSSADKRKSPQLQQTEETMVDQEPNTDRKKRRKSASPARTPEGTPSPIDVGQRAEDLGWHDQLRAEAEKVNTTPKKVLKLNGHGTLLSPPLESTQAGPSTPKPKRGRKKAKAKAAPGPLVIKYGSDIESRLEIGRKIDLILASPRTSVEKAALVVKPSSKLSGPPKQTHPFFLGKPAQKKDTSPVETKSCSPPSRTPKKSAVTPGKLRTDVQQIQSPRESRVFGPIFGDKKLLKHPGMTDAPWPTRETCHVRNIDHDELQSLMLTTSCPSPVTRIRKLKNNVITVPDKDDIIIKTVAKLRHALDLSLERIDYHVVDDAIRLPARLLTTGFNIQMQVRQELSAGWAGLIQEAGSKVHPVLKHLYSDIENTLTPFDKGECESQSWVQKYAPRAAKDVLQSGNESVVLRDWLQSLTITAVESRKESGKGGKGQQEKKAPKKKRKALDDFIVGSDDEDFDELVEIPDSEQYGPSPLSHRYPKSLRSSRNARDKNVIILSGPSGCGKSAAVYAVAKELGFEVFEINSSSRRTGKDVQDRVGDMTGNHLVNNKAIGIPIEHGGASVEDEDDHLAVAFREDLESGRQGTMKSFFQPASKPTVAPKAKTNNKAPQKAANTKIGTLMDQKQKTLAPPRHQKQSLILLEEADILYEEDQQFWAQVIKLASQSKRPIVITCNDETAIPTQALPLGGILRFTPPPVELTVDCMLLLCAREGHLLRRSAVHDLYKAKGYDLRASINELDFWCQMSVGDRKGGLDWIYQRWPPGKDVDEHGRTLRVVSEGTYLSGMGWTSHDIAASGDQSGFDKEEELLKGVWQDWGIDPVAMAETEPLISRESSNPQAHISDTASRGSLGDLKKFDQILGTLSAADQYSRIGLPSSDNEMIDPSLPPMLDKERRNYVVDTKIMNAEPISDFHNFDSSIFTQTQLSLHRLRKSSSNLGSHQEHDDPVINERILTSGILHNITKEDTDSTLTRWNFSNAFDILASHSSVSSNTSSPYPLTASSFDRPFNIIVEDLAPSVRAIVAHDLRLENQQIRLSNLLSEGGTGKRLRTTRASRVAREGGRRESKRRDQWLPKDLKKFLVMATAGKTWAALGALPDESDQSRTSESLASSQ